MSNSHKHEPHDRFWDRVKYWPVVGAVLRYLHALLRLPRLHMGVLVLEDKVTQDRADLAEMQRRQATFEQTQLPELVEALSGLNSRVVSHESDRDNLLAAVPAQLRAASRDLAGLLARLDAMESEWSGRFAVLDTWQREFSTEQLPELLELQRRQLAFEDEQLPVLIRNLAEVNSRLLAGEQDTQNLTLSLPPQVRGLRKDLAEAMAQLQSKEASLAASAAQAHEELRAELEAQLHSRLADANRGLQDARDAMLALHDDVAATRQRMDAIDAQMATAQSRVEAVEQLSPELSEVVRRQATFEEQQLPALASTLAAINRRVLELSSQAEAEAISDLYASRVGWRENGV